MASKDEKQVPMELEGAGGDGDDAELVLAMVTSPSLSSSDAGAILLGLCITSCMYAMLLLYHHNIIIIHVVVMVSCSLPSCDHISNFYVIILCN